MSLESQCRCGLESEKGRGHLQRVHSDRKAMKHQQLKGEKEKPPKKKHPQKTRKTRGSHQWRPMQLTSSVNSKCALKI